MSGFGLVDDVIPEPLGGAHADPEKMAETLKYYLIETLSDLNKINFEDRINLRIEKLSNMGFYDEIDVTTDKNNDLIEKQLDRVI